MTGRKCRVCKVEKPRSAFHKNVRQKAGIQTDCKDCSRVRHKARRNADPEKFLARQRNANYLQAYGITTDQRNALVEAQGGFCKLCGRETALVVDHDHRTGKVRGMLCGRCNTGLGKLLDSPALLRKAAEYIESHGTSAS